MKFILLAFILNFLISFHVRAQIADISYSSGEFALNPAVISRRDLGLFGATVNYESEKTVSSQTNRIISLTKNEVIFATAKSKLVPELYLQHAKGENQTETQLINQTSKTTSRNKTEITYAQVSLATGFWDRAQFAINLANLQQFTEFGNYQSNFYGLGFRFALTSSFSFGGYWRRMPTSNPQNSAEVDQWSVGISYLRGNPKAHSLRFETSYLYMSPIMPRSVAESDRLPGQEIVVAIEGSLNRFLGGFKISQTQGIILDPNNLLKNILYSSDRPLNEPIINYEFFLGLRTQKGHSFGISGLSSTGSQKVFISQEKVDAFVSTVSGRLSYAYWF